MVSSHAWTHRRMHCRSAFVGVLVVLLSTLSAYGLASASSPPLSMGITRAQTEALFHYIDGRHTVFHSASSLKGIPRVLGADSRLFIAVEINGNPQVVDVQVVSIVDSASKTTLEEQVSYLSLACLEFASKAAQKWCLGRILNTNALGLVNASAAKNYNGLRITVKTYRPKLSSGPPIISVDLKPAV
jgi:hypothetical protein